MSGEKVHVCFVCLGNICRSPTAEGVMRALVADQGFLDHISIDSAGTAAYHVGERPDRRARQAAGRRGIALESRARQFVADDLSLHHYVLAMDQQNLEDLESLVAANPFEGQLALLRDFDPVSPPGAEVPDPYYGGENGFEQVLDLCHSACLGLIDQIRRDRKLG